MLASDAELIKIGRRKVEDLGGGQHGNTKVGANEAGGGGGVLGLGAEIPLQARKLCRVKGGAGWEPTSKRLELRENTTYQKEQEQEQEQEQEVNQVLQVQRQA
ncbi:hypothetical protein HGM15179_021679 [Zosterops borbonicus]|uniref:Uncharacterized protein n=1 Tax=Zosterops borbonicus TaxID=364589 RepID=A0A8K1D6S9_9PASS|nr:hypothetical protein HGM15179_021679 [Zosterops borbonicus]